MSEKEKEAIELLKGYDNKLVYEISEKDKIAVKTVINLIQKQQKEIEKKDKIIDNTINFIQDNCLEEIADMKGCYRETASVGDLEELINILKGK